MTRLNEDWIVQPHGELQMLAEGLLTVEGTIEMPLGRFPRRMTVIGLAAGGSAIWSPVPLDEPCMARIDALGPVRFLIVPNQAHRLDLKAWCARYPFAKVIAPPSAKSAVSEAAPVHATHDAIEDPSIDFYLVAGTKADEFALLVERDDGLTLILNDILANVQHPHGLGAQVMTRLLGFGIHRPRTSRTVKSLFVEDGLKVAEQFRAWAALPGLRRIIVSHGDVIETAPARALETAAADFA